MAYFINLSNHPSENWCEKQIAAARDYGEIIDLPFPEIATNAESAQIDAYAEEFFEKIIALKPSAVMVQGEFVFTFRLVTKLKAAQIVTLASSSERVANEQITDFGSVKTSEFEFVCFREY